MMSMPKLKSTKKLDDNIHIWKELDQLAEKYKFSNLTDSIPHLQPPKFLVDNLLEAVNNGKM